MFDMQSLGVEYGALLMLGMLVALLLTGMPLAFVTLLVALFFTVGWFGPTAIPLVTSRVYSFVSSFVFVAVPMFVLMASILDRSGIAHDLFDAMKLIGGRLRGSVAVQTIFAAVILAAMSGIIGGEIVLLGMIALPQMLRLGYDRGLAIGVVCAGGSLGTMVPPSIVLIIYGLTANVSIGDLFVAAAVPGLMLAAFYVTYVLIRVHLDPAAAPKVDPDERTGAEKIKLLRGLIIPILVVLMVMGSIYGGIASVTEASAVGVAGVLLATIVRGEFTVELLRSAALQTLRTCGMIVWIGVGASALVGVFNLMGGINFVSSLIVGVSETPVVVILTMMAILFVLGMFLDWVGIALLTMPIFVPVVISLGYDPVWFGVLFAMNMQVSYLSPPFGPAVFYLKSVAPPDITLVHMFRAVAPFICLQVAAVGLLILLPWLAFH